LLKLRQQAQIWRLAVCLGAFGALTAKPLTLQSNNRELLEDCLLCLLLVLVYIACIYGAACLHCGSGSLLQSVALLAALQFMLRLSVKLSVRNCGDLFCLETGRAFCPTVVIS
jgi:hypothetical protein